MRYGVSLLLRVALRIRFPSVLLQPLGHLSVLVESTVYGPVVEPETPNCVRNCVRPPNVLRSLTAIWSRLATEVRCDTSVRLRPSSIERGGRIRLRPAADLYASRARSGPSNRRPRRRTEEGFDEDESVFREGLPARRRRKIGLARRVQDWTAPRTGSLIDSANVRPKSQISRRGIP